MLTNNERNIITQFLKEKNNTDEVFKSILLSQVEYHKKIVTSFNINLFLNNNYSILYSQYKNTEAARSLKFTNEFELSYYKSFFNKQAIFTDTMIMNIEYCHNSIMCPIAEYYDLYGKFIKLKYLNNPLINRGKAVIIDVDFINIGVLYDDILNKYININYGVMYRLSDTLLFITVYDKSQDVIIDKINIFSPNFQINSLMEIK